jgi:SAM-dependent methyltransferase
MTDVWSERAEAYRRSVAHSEGPDLDLIVEWAAGAKTALDVASGGGHVARRLREAGLKVVTTDAAPGMQPDVVSRGEDLPFAESSFDVVACRLGAHHFADVRAAVGEMARVAARTVIVVDNTFGGEALEEAERVRDPSHVRCYTAEEWRAYLEDAGLAIDDVRFTEMRIELEPWLERAGCTGVDADRVRELAAARIAGGWITLDRIAVKAVKEARG